MIFNKRFILASSLCMSMICTAVIAPFIASADDEIHEPPTFGVTVDTQTTTQTVAPAGNPPAAGSAAPAASGAATPQNNTQSKQMISTYTLGQSRSPDETQAMVLGVVGGSYSQRAEVVCAPKTGYQSTPHFLANYAFNKLGGGFGIRGIDHIQVMMIKKGYVTDKTQKKATRGLTLRDKEVSSVPTETASNVAYRQIVYRYSTDWAWFTGFISHRGSNKLLAATNDGNIQGIYVTVNGIPNSSIFGMFNQTITSLGSNAGTLGLAAIGLSK